MYLSSISDIKFGSFFRAKVHLENIHGAIVLAILGGLLGALFIDVNGRVNKIRKKLFKTKLSKVGEVAIFAVGMVTMMFLAVSIFGQCVDIPKEEN